MTNETLLSNLDRDAKALKPAIELGSALEKLRSNRDFNKLIVEGYLKDEAIRLVHLKADPALQSPEHQAAIDRDISAIGVLNQFFITTEQRARMAHSQLSGIEETRAEVLAEGL